MIIEVTDADYWQAERFSPWDCAIAKALNRQVGGMAEVRAGSIKIHNGSTVVDIETPLMGELTSRIYEFDTYGKCEAFRFCLNYMGNALEMEYAEDDLVLVG
jgi:hypothetical protein